ncbi:MAG: M48 family metalloprotease [Phycisphaera sp. RhM]|nr:M48 family metalloprotease [Phycisphaera sp. RhM]
MSDLASLTGNVGVFLLTYLLHSTLAFSFVAAATYFLGRRRNSELRVLAWKMVLCVPVVTTLAVTVMDVPHFGLQFPVRIAVSEVAGETSRDNPAASQERTVPARPASTENNRSQTADETSAGGADQRFASTPFTSVRVAAGDSPNASPLKPPTDRSAWGLVVATWLLGIVVGALGLVAQLTRLLQLRERASAISTGDLCRSLNRLRRNLGIRCSVDLLRTADLPGPVAAGILRPFILIPQNICPDSVAVGGRDASPSTGRELSASERDALLAHELAHVAQCDALWNLIVQIISRVFFFQPLNWLAGRELRKEMDFLADAQAALVLGHRTGLAHCLIRLGDQMSRASGPVGPVHLAAAMAAFRSTLGQRIETLLDTDNDLRRMSRWSRLAALAVMLSGSIMATVIVPRAIALATEPSPPPTMPHEGNEPMKKQVAALAMATALVIPAAGDEPATRPASPPPTTELKATPDALPPGIRKFNGMVVGRLAAKDIERGTFVVHVDAVSRVWRNSQAENPQSIVGKSVAVGGVFGKFLDVLVVTRIGETIEFECKHDGDGLKFPGEMLRKVAPYRPQDYPKLPESFRGFQGSVIADIVKKDPEAFEMIIKVSSVKEVWNKNTAKEPRSIEGRTMMLAGFWNRKEVYHSLKPGDRIEVGMQHIGRQSEHLTVAEFVRKANAGSEKAAMEPIKRMEREPAAADGLASGQNGFRGMLVGRLVQKDVERGTFTITVDAVPRIWNKNRVDNPKAIVGQNVQAGGVSGKLLDVLVVSRVGETVEFGALHEGGPFMRVVEVLRKVAPVSPGDYPELPEAVRGIKAVVTAKVVKKDQEMMGLIVEVTRVDELLPGSDATDADSIVGRRVMLDGFWKRKELYQDLRVGDVIRSGVVHQQRLSDNLAVAESVKKIDG